MKETYGTYDIARICQVSPPTIGRWIDEGKLPAFTTAGGHRRVWAKDLVVFLGAHNLPVPPDLCPSRLRILIADDEPSIRRIIVRIIQARFPQCETHEAEDGFEAGHKVGTLAPSLVILDIGLPGLDGFKVCRLIRKD